jgi:hypothetical protein
MYSMGKDIQSELAVVPAAPKSTATAGGSGDATLVHGTAIDTTALLTPGGSAQTPAIEGNCRYNSVMFILDVTATLADTKGIGVTASIETCAASNFSSGVVTLVATETIISYTDSGGNTQQLTGKIGCSLDGALQFVRVSYTPDLTASGTDVADLQACAVFGGANEYP